MRRGYLAISIVVVLILSCGQLFAQGSIHGVVLDSTANQKLPGANVFLVGTALGGVTDREGEYTISKVPAGAYRLKVSYIGYVSKMFDVRVADGVSARIDVRLIPDVIEGAEVVVTGQARGQSAAINQQLSSKTIVNVISEEKIQELPDANAAEAIGRLPGVSIIRSGGEASKVILRGLSDKFTTVSVDGVRIAPTDADDRGLDLSTISQGSLAGVELFKALTSDKEADAIGGSINLVNRKAPEERLLRLDARGIYNKLMTAYDQYDFSFRYGERFFEKLLGVQVQANLESRNRSNERFNLNYQQTGDVSKGTSDYVINNFVLEFTDEIRKRNGAGLLLDLETPDGGNIRINNMYSRTDRDYLYSTRNYPNGPSQLLNYTAEDIEQKTITYTGSVQGHNFLVGLEAVWGLSFAQSSGDSPYDYYIDFQEPSFTDGSGHIISGMGNVPTGIKDHPEVMIPYALNNYQAAYLNNAYYRTGRNLDKERTAYLDISGKYRLWDILTGETKVGARYRMKNRVKELGQEYSPYYLTYWQPFFRAEDGSIRRKDFSGTWFNTFYQRFRMNNSARDPFAVDFLDQNPAWRNLFDKYALRPIVNRDALRLWYAINKDGVDSLGRNREYFDDPSVFANYYDVIERVGGAYIMNTLNFGQEITFIAGVRVENEDNDYKSRYSPVGLGGFPIPSGVIRDTSASHSQTYWLPNFQLLLRPTEFLNVRLAAYRAVARPDFNLRLNKYLSSGFGGASSLTLGNPHLKTATAWNYEINTSVYSNTIGLVSVSAYYKEITDLFHTLNNAGTIGNSIIDQLGISWRTPLTGAYSLTAPYNSPKPTKVWGFEFEHQMDFKFLPGFLKNFVLSYNASLVRSQTTIIATDTFTVIVRVPSGFPPPFDSLTVPITNNKIVEKQQRMEGQPEFYANVALGYDFGTTSIRLSMFHQAEYNLSFSSNGSGDRVSNSLTRWDLAVRHQLNGLVTLFFNVNNLTNASDATSIYNRVAGWKLADTSESYGLTADLGVRLTF